MINNDYLAEKYRTSSVMPAGAPYIYIYIYHIYIYIYGTLFLVTIGVDIFCSQCCSNAVPTLHWPLLPQRCSDAVPTLLQRCSNAVPTLLQHCSNGFWPNAGPLCQRYFQRCSNAAMTLPNAFSRPLFANAASNAVPTLHWRLPLVFHAYAKNIKHSVLLLYP